MKIVMALSGGLDSAVLLAHLVRNGHEVLAVNVQYGSKHNPLEGSMASLLAAGYQVPLRFMDVSGSLLGNDSTLMKDCGDVPRGHYEEESMRRTVVPGRNLVIVAALASYAETMNAEVVMLGVHAGDHFIYPDCRPAFVHAANQVVNHSTDGKVMVMATFLRWTKRDIVAKGLEWGVPMNLTRTCYTDDVVACGTCGSCQERLEAFALNNAVDPLDYVTRTLVPKKAKAVDGEL